MVKVCFARMCVQTISWSNMEDEIVISYPGSCVGQSPTSATHSISSSEGTWTLSGIVLASALCSALWTQHFRAVPHKNYSHLPIVTTGLQISSHQSPPTLYNKAKQTWALVTSQWLATLPPLPCRQSSVCQMSIQVAGEQLISEGWVT